MNRILLIDDEQEVRDVYRHMLADQPLEIFEATNGQDALRMASESPFDLYLTDIVMPRMSGFEFLKHLREIDPNSVVIIISGYDDIAYNRQAMLYGAWRYLVKPIKRAEMLLLIEQGLKEHDRLHPATTHREETPPPPPAKPPKSHLDAEAFDLLGKLTARPTVEFYQENAEALEENVVQPFQFLWSAIMAKLPPAIADTLDRQAYPFEPILKKTFKGNRVRSTYHAAAILQGGNRDQDGQLYFGIDGNQLEFGFFIGEFGNDQRSRFLNNMQQMRRGLLKYLRPRLDSLSGVAGQRLVRLLYCRSLRNVEPMLLRWIDVPGELAVHYSVVIPREQAPDAETLIRTIVDGFTVLYPLLPLAFYDHPEDMLMRCFDSPRSDWEEPSAATEVLPQPSTSSSLPVDEPAASIAPEPTPEIPIESPISEPEPQPEVHEEPPLEETVPAPEPELPTPTPSINVTEPEPLPVPEEPNPVYPLSVTARETGIDVDILNDWIELLRNEKSLLLHAPWGCGSHEIAEAIARHLIGETHGITETIPLHHAYTYPDFMHQVIRFVHCLPPLEPGVLILEGLHRVDPDDIFGELPYLLKHRGQTVYPAQSNELLALPSNLLLLCTFDRESLARAPQYARLGIPLVSCDPDWLVVGNAHEEGSDRRLLEVLVEIDRLLRIENLGLALFDTARNLPRSPEEARRFWQYRVEPMFALTGNPRIFEDYRWDALISGRLSDWDSTPAQDN